MPGIEVVLRLDEATVLWEKAARLAVLSAATVASGARLGVLRTDADWRTRMEVALAESCAVAVAEGVELDPAAQWAIIDALPDDLTTSTARDAIGGRPTELDAIAGARRPRRQAPRHRDPSARAAPGRCPGGDLGMTSPVPGQPGVPEDGQASPSAVALIGARSGSERVHGKNVRFLAGHPLLAYAIETARQSRVFDRIVVSTDDEAIAKVARWYGADVPGLRPDEYADRRPRRTSSGSPGHCPGSRSTTTSSRSSARRIRSAART